MQQERHYFGTDGIRGKANEFPITPDVMMRVAMAAAKTLSQGDHRHTVVIGKDTRLSGYMIESALSAGFSAMGVDVVTLGPLPTPAVAMLTRSLRADFGVMISASHNLYQDNGIKFFGPDGMKLTDGQELAIEALIVQGQTDFVVPKKIGKASHLDDAQGRYIEFIKATFPRQQRLDGLKIVVDCANGAAYRVAPGVLWELGADVIKIGVEPNGFNINDKCGATSLDLLRRTVVEQQADVGIALDGDADRLIMVDENGKIVDGDHLLATIATAWQASGQLNKNTVVATQMSNLGFERYLKSRGIKLIRTNVGDRYVLEAMIRENLNLGGEQSGHLLLTDYGTTGDGLLAALHILNEVVKQRLPLSQITHLFEPFPQVLINVKLNDRKVLESKTIQTAIHEAEQQLSKASGRLLVRLSGTETLVRLMGEADDKELLQQVLKDLESAILEVK